MCYISAPEQNPLRINYRVYFHHDNKTSPSARMWLMAQIKRSIIMFLWIFDHCIRAVTGSQICWTVFILSSRKLSSELICCGGLHGSVRSFTRGQKPRDEKRQKYNSERGRRRRGYPDNQFTNYQISLQVRHSLLCIYIFHCIVLNSVCKIVNTSHLRLTCFFVRGRCVCVCVWITWAVGLCVCFYMHTLTAVESLEARVISRFPFMPNTAGTRMRSSVTSWNTSQFCHESTRSKTHHRGWITLNTTRRTTNRLYSEGDISFEIQISFGWAIFFLFPKFLLELISAQQNPGLLYLCLPSAPVSTLHLSLGKTRNDN